MPEPLEVLWSLAPVEIKLELSLNLIVEVLKMSEGRHAEITLEAEFNDADQTISWWLWGAPHAGEVPESCYITDEKRRKEWHVTDAGNIHEDSEVMEEQR